MVKDHSDSEKGNPLPPRRLLLSISSKGSFICTIPDRITHTTAFVTPVMEHWLEREILKRIKSAETGATKLTAEFLFSTSVQRSSSPESIPDSTNI